LSRCPLFLASSAKFNLGNASRPHRSGGKEGGPRSRRMRGDADDRRIDRPWRHTGVQRWPTKAHEWDHEEKPAASARIATPPLNPGTTKHHGLLALIYSTGRNVGRIPKTPAQVFSGFSRTQLESCKQDQSPATSFLCYPSLGVSRWVGLLEIQSERFSGRGRVSFAEELFPRPVQGEARSSTLTPEHGRPYGNDEGKGVILSSGYGRLGVVRPRPQFSDAI